MFGKLAVAATFVLGLQPVLGAVYITSPVGSTSAIGGQVLNVNWQDDGNSPTLAEIGPSAIDLYTGSKTIQTKLQNLGASVDVSKTSSIMATIDPTIGQNGNYYFIRVTSLGLAAGNGSNYNYEAFSSTFTINSMTGTFNATVLAAINGTSSAATSATSAIVSDVSSKASSVSTKISSTTAKTSTTAKSSTVSSGAGSRVVLSGAAVVAGLVGAATFVF